MNVSPVPAGYPTITPYLVSKDARKLLEFLKQGLDASVDTIHSAPDGRIMNAVVTIGTSKIMVGEAREPKDLRHAMLYLYVEDCDALYQRAVGAGAKSVMEPRNQFYGDRSGAVDDLDGNQWWFATQKEVVSQEEMERRMSSAKA